MKKTVLSLTLLLAAQVSFADNRSMDELHALAVAKLSAAAAVKGVVGSVASAADIRLVADEDAYAIFTPTNADGFVIVAKSDLVEPVIGYSTERLDPADMPNALKWFLRTVSRRLTTAEAGACHAPRHTAATYTPVENFVTTKWSQDYPFDRKTPNNYPAGCVATALAQCLNYCQYPPSAEFDALYWVTTTQGKKETTTRKSEHVSTTYNWPYKDTYKTFGKYGDNIDELLRDCGYATYMQYAQDASGTVSLYAGMALTTVFGYPEESIKYYEQSSFNGDLDAWIQIIYDELAARSPVLYGAHDPELGGHAFIFTGVDADGLVYVNWGWRGSADGFYNIELLDPRGRQEHFTESHHMVTGIRTTPQATDHIAPRIWGYTGDPFTFRWGTEKDDDDVEHHTLYCDLPYGFVNWSPTSFQGVFGLFAQDLTDGTEWVIAEDLQDRDTIPAGYGYCGDEEAYKEFCFYYYIDGEKGLKPGHTYRMSFGTKDDREGTWHSILCQGGELGYEITYTGDPETSTVSEERADVPVLNAIRDVAAHASTAGDGLARVYDTSGRIVYTCPEARFNLWEIPMHGTFVVRMGGKTQKVVR